MGTIVQLQYARNFALECEPEFHSVARRGAENLPGSAQDGSAHDFQIFSRRMFVALLNLERETGIEPATNGLGSRYSTIELLPLYNGLYLYTVPVEQME